MEGRSAIRSLALLALLAALVVLQARLWFGAGSIRDGMLLEKQMDALKAENAKLTERNDLMAADVQDLKHGTDEVEEIARKDLGMIKRDETFYQLMDGDKPSAAATTGSKP